MIKSLITEYGPKWIINRSLYSAKLKMMKVMPQSAALFEKAVKVRRTNIFNIDVESIEAFLERKSTEEKQGIVTIADKAIEGKIMGFSSVELDYGKPINWQRNPITNREVDNSLKWYQISDFDPIRGDIKAVWEASRLTHFFHFVRAYMITKDLKYYQGFSNQLAEWLQSNPYTYGANYKCGQEATLRMINAIIAYSAFKAYGRATSRDDEHIRQLISDSYKKVLSNFFYAHKCIKNNHTLSEITGLIIGAWACENQRKLSHAYGLLNKEIQKQFFTDGGYTQFSFNYQRFALQLMEFVAKISERTNIHLSEQSQNLLYKSASLLYQMQDDTGDVPNYGSNDGALIFPVTSCGYRDFRPVVNTVNAIFGGKRVYEPGAYDEELLWFAEGAHNIPVVKLQKKSSFFSESGLYSLRRDNGFVMSVLQNFKSRPAQMDQHHFDLWHKGVNVFCDSGTYSYATDLGKSLALTAAHNTVTVQGEDQMKKRGPFLVYDWTKRGEVKHENDRFTGTMISLNHYEHTRTIESSPSGYRISDAVVTEADYCEFYFYTPCKVEKTAAGFGLYDGDKLIGLLSAEGDYKVESAFRSLYYLKKEEINRIVFKCAISNKKCEKNFMIELYD